jgi:predicted ester cyclase
MSEAAMAKSNSPDAATVIRQWFDEVWNQGREEAIDRLFPEHATMWGVGRPEVSSKGSAEFKEFYRRIRLAFPDTKIALHQVVQEGDTAFARWTVTATHTGEGLGMGPTNQQLKIVGMSACRVSGGVIVEGWNLWDQIGMARQLGILQGPAAQMFP